MTVSTVTLRASTSHKLLRGLLAPPALVFAGFLLLFALSSSESATSLANVELAFLELGLPLAAAVGAAGIVHADPALELLCTVKRPLYATTFLRLLALLLFVVALALAFQAAAGLRDAPPLAPHHGSPAFQLVWLSPTLALAAFGLAAALLGGGQLVGTCAIGLAWAGELLFNALLLANPVGQKLFLPLTLFMPGAGFWGTNRATLLAVALCLLFLAYERLHDPEVLLKGRTQ